MKEVNKRYYNKAFLQAKHIVRSIEIITTFGIVYRALTQHKFSKSLKYEKI